MVEQAARQGEPESMDFEVVTREEVDMLMTEIESVESNQRAELAMRLTQRSSSMLFEGELTAQEQAAQDLAEAQNAELKEYISEMVLMISTGKEEVDKANIDVVADGILAKSLQVHAEYIQQLERNLEEL